MLVTTGPAPLTPCPHHPDADSALAELRRTAVDNRRAPASAVEEVLSATWPAMAVPAAGYWNGLSAATYERLLDLGDPQVTARVAGNLGTPAYLIRRLYEAEQGRWRAYVLSNGSSIPIDLMVDQALAGRSGGGHFHWDVEGVMALADHPDPRVRMVPLNHVRRQPRVVSALIDDPDPAVALLAALCSGDPEKHREAARRYGPSGYEQLAHQLNCPADVLLTIAQDGRSPFEAVLAVAYNGNATPAVLAACLSNQPGPEMDEAVAEHPSASPEQLWQVVRAGNPSALRAAANNANLPPHAVDLVLASCLDP
ncbi:hypothetical protein [Kitasatospora sp. NPDC097691]|uniref:hypothetical protein n=1 Tax=Kitasatospora sp. NPDC097691 TaxID=3157231 RepID=UPI00332D09D2